MSDQETNNEEAARRGFARALFGTEPDEQDEQDDEHKPPTDNRVPKEGSNPRLSTNDDMREFARALFDTRD